MHISNVTAITARYIDAKFQLQDYLLAFEHVAGSHTGEHLATIVLDVLKRYDITDKLGYITTDNAANNSTMSYSLKCKLCALGIEWNVDTNHIPCMAHIVNLCVQHFIDMITDEHEISSITTIIEKIHRISQAHRVG